MTKYFYKYTPVRKDFFDNLMLRATPFISLNDPFEGNFNDDQIKNADNALNSFGAENNLISNDLFANDLDAIMGCMESDFNSVGVLSFSEECSNHAMWANYADSNKGIVIEFDYSKPLFQDSIKKLNGRKSRFGKDPLGLTYEFPEKVMYKNKNEMPTFSYLEEAKPSSTDEYPWLKTNHTLFFTKTDDWSYEKELRSIVPLMKADSVICQPNEQLLEILSSHNKITYKYLDKNKIQIIFPNEFAMLEETGDQSIRDEIMYTINNDFYTNIYLFRINPQAITSIFCGYKSNYDEIKSLIQKNEKLSQQLQEHIFFMDKNSNTYQLEPILK